MKLTPLDVRKQEFKRTMRGFDPEEVEAFLMMVADELELHIRDKNQYNDELIKLRTQLRDYQRVESTLRDTLVKAQNTVEDSRVNSRREAEIILHEAELQADNIIKDAREEFLSMRHEISLLKAQKEAIAKRLRHMLESQLEMLEIMEGEDFTRFDISQKPPETPQHTREPLRQERTRQPEASPRQQTPRIVKPERSQPSNPGRVDLSKDMRPPRPSGLDTEAQNNNI